MSDQRTNPAANARGPKLLLGGRNDPKVVATAAPRGCVYIRENSVGKAIGRYVKIDDGKTTKWNKLPDFGSGVQTITQIVDFGDGDGDKKLFTADGSEFITRGTIIVVSAFNAATRINIGKVGTPESVMPKANNLPDAVGHYKKSQQITGVLADDYRVFFTFGGSATGKAVAIIERTIITGEIFI